MSGIALVARGPRSTIVTLLWREKWPPTSPRLIVVVLLTVAGYWSAAATAVGVVADVAVGVVVGAVVGDMAAHLAVSIDGCGVDADVRRPSPLAWWSTC